MTHPIVQATNKAIIYRASALGSCIRSLWAARSGYDPKPVPEQFQQIFATGHKIEELTKAILVEHGYSIINNEYELHIDFGPMVELVPVWILGHIDCDSKLLPEQQYVTTEIKGFGKTYLDKYIKTDLTAFPAYRYQIASYLHARTQTRFRFIIYQKTHPSAEDSFDRLIIRDYEVPPCSRQELESRCLEVEMLVGKHTVNPADVVCSNNYPCPYFYLHTTTEALPLTPQQLALVRVIKGLDAKLAEIEEAKTRFRGQLSHQLSQTMNYRAAGYNVYWSDKPDRLNQQVAKEILRSAGVEYDEYMVKGEGRQLNIREPKKPASDG